MMNRHFCQVIKGLLLLVLILGGGCGYRMQGTAPLPGGIKAVRVNLFENRSSRSGAENVFTNAFINELLKKTDVRVLKTTTAGGVVTGTIRSISVGDLTRSSDDTVLQGRVSAILDLLMTDVDGVELWSVKGFAGNEIYTASSSNVTDEAAQQEAVAQIALRMSEKLVSAMSDQW